MYAGIVLLIEYCSNVGVVGSPWNVYILHMWKVSLPLELLYVVRRGPRFGYCHGDWNLRLLNIRRVGATFFFAWVILTACGGS